MRSLPSKCSQRSIPDRLPPPQAEGKDQPGPPQKLMLSERLPGVGEGGPAPGGLPPRSNPRNGNRAGGRVSPWSSSNASSSSRNRSSVRSQSRPLPPLGWVSFRFCHCWTRGQASPNTSASSFVRLQGHQVGILPPQLDRPPCRRAGPCRSRLRHAPGGARRVQLRQRPLHLPKRLALLLPDLPDGVLGSTATGAHLLAQRRDDALHVPQPVLQPVVAAPLLGGGGTRPRLERLFQRHPRCAA